MKVTIIKKLAKKNLKVLLVTDGYPPVVAGAQIFVSRLAQGLFRNGVDVYVFAPSTNLEYMEERIGGVTVYRFPSVPLPGGWKNERLAIFPYSRARKILKDINPDIMHIQTPGTLCFACTKLAKQTKLPLVFSNNILPENIFDYNGIKFPFRKTLENFYSLVFSKLYNRGKCVITPSKYGRKFLRDIGVVVPINVISCGVPEEFMKIAKHVKSHNNKLRILYAGRLAHEKNIETIINAVEIVITKNSGIKVTLIGDGHNRKRLQAIVKKKQLEKHFEFKGFLNNTEYKQEFSTNDIFIMPSNSELQGIVVLEALASGLPVIAARSKALPELVKHGKNGLLFKADDAIDLSKKILFVDGNRQLWRKWSKSAVLNTKNDDRKITYQKHCMLYAKHSGIKP